MSVCRVLKRAQLEQPDSLPAQKQQATRCVDDVARCTDLKIASQLLILIPDLFYMDWSGSCIG